MSVVRSEIRPGAYYDSIVLMRLQSALAALPGVEDAGVVMGTAANLDLLRDGGLLAPQTRAAAAEDLVVVVRAGSETEAAAALGRIDELLARRSAGADEAFRPRSLASAAKLLPAARWVLVSVPGRHAGKVAREALEHGRHVFLYSDNVPLAEEIELKRRAGERGLLVMGPDCGTAVVRGIGMGFANRVRRGAVGLVAASGTGLQAAACRVHELGEGVSHALGTGGRDLHAEVGGATALAALDLLRRDPGTRSIALISKPPDPAVAARLLAAARGAGKPVVVYFLGYPAALRELDGVRFAASLEESAELAVAAARSPGTPPAPYAAPAPGSGYLRGLFAGGTLALETLAALRTLLHPLYSNLEMDGVAPLAGAGPSRGHTVLDLGADELTVGRLHPMLDQDLRLRRLRREADDPDTGLLLLDAVLGEGAHPDPAAELAPAIAEIKRRRPGLEVIVLVLAAPDDRQDPEGQGERLREAGAVVVRRLSAALERVGQALLPAAEPAAGVSLDALETPVAALNVGLEAFHSSLVDQGAEAIQVDWRPPAGGDERLMAILAKMERKAAS